MYNITLLSSFHKIIGKCNPDELYKIIEEIRPEIIFEELSYNTFPIIYADGFIPESLEAFTIKEYLKKYPIKHFPVDIDPNPNLATSDIDYMFSTFKKYDVYKKLENEQNLLTAQDGFAFLNSTECSELFDKKMITEKYLMEFMINKNQLIHTYKLFHEEQDNRENEMLQNIYNFSKENQYNQAVFLIGSAHRNSIMQKITEYETKEKLKLNWTFYSKQDF